MNTNSPARAGAEEEMRMGTEAELRVKVARSMALAFYGWDEWDSENDAFRDKWLKRSDSFMADFGALVPRSVLIWITANPEAAKGLASGEMLAVPQERVAQLRAELEATRAELARVAPPNEPIPKGEEKAMTNTDEAAWVIERYNHDTLLYWTGRPTLGTWSANHADALRFARKTDAAAMLTWHCDSLGRVAEHMWLAASPPAPSGKAPGET